MFDATITTGDLIQIGAFLILVLGVWKGHHRRQSKIDTLLGRHDVRIENNENNIERHDGEIRELRVGKRDK